MSRIPEPGWTSGLPRRSGPGPKARRSSQRPANPQLLIHIRPLSSSRPMAMEGGGPQPAVKRPSFVSSRITTNMRTSLDRLHKKISSKSRAGQRGPASPGAVRAHRDSTTPDSKEVEGSPRQTTRFVETAIDAREVDCAGSIPGPDPAATESEMLPTWHVLQQAFRKYESLTGSQNDIVASTITPNNDEADAVSHDESLCEEPKGDCGGLSEDNHADNSVSEKSDDEDYADTALSAAVDFDDVAAAAAAAGDRKDVDVGAAATNHSEIVDGECAETNVGSGLTVIETVSKAVVGDSAPVDDPESDPSKVDNGLYASQYCNIAAAKMFHYSSNIVADSHQSDMKPVSGFIHNDCNDVVAITVVQGLTGSVLSHSASTVFSGVNEPEADQLDSPSVPLAVSPNPGPTNCGSKFESADFCAPPQPAVSITVEPMKHVDHQKHLEKLQQHIGLSEIDICQEHRLLSDNADALVNDAKNNDNVSADCRSSFAIGVCDDEIVSGNDFLLLHESKGSLNSHAADDPQCKLEPADNSIAENDDLNEVQALPDSDLSDDILGNDTSERVLSPVCNGIDRSDDGCHLLQEHAVACDRSSGKTVESPFDLQTEDLLDSLLSSPEVPSAILDSMSYADEDTASANVRLDLIFEDNIDHEGAKKISAPFDQIVVVSDSISLVEIEKIDTVVSTNHVGNVVSNYTNSSEPGEATTDEIADSTSAVINDHTAEPISVSDRNAGRVEGEAHSKDDFSDAASDSNCHTGSDEARSNLSNSNCPLSLEENHDAAGGITSHCQEEPTDILLYSNIDSEPDLCPERHYSAQDSCAAETDISHHVSANRRQDIKHHAGRQEIINPTAQSSTVADLAPVASLEEPVSLQNPLSPRIFAVVKQNLRRAHSAPPSILSFPTSPSFPDRLLANSVIESPHNDEMDHDLKSHGSNIESSRGETLSEHVQQLRDQIQQALGWSKSEKERATRPRAVLYRRRYRPKQLSEGKPFTSITTNCSEKRTEVDEHRVTPEGATWHLKKETIDQEGKGIDDRCCREARCFRCPFTNDVGLESAIVTMDVHIQCQPVQEDRDTQCCVDVNSDLTQTDAAHLAQQSTQTESALRQQDTSTQTTPFESHCQAVQCSATTKQSEAQTSTAVADAMVQYCDSDCGKLASPASKVQQSFTDLDQHVDQFIRSISPGRSLLHERQKRQFIDSVEDPAKGVFVLDDGRPLKNAASFGPRSLVSLNIGGQRFDVLRSTLARYPETLLGKIATLPLPVYIDRSPVLFPYIIDAYRTGAHHVPSANLPSTYLESLLDEARFYQIEQRMFPNGVQAPATEAKISFDKDKVSDDDEGQCNQFELCERCVLVPGMSATFTPRTNETLILDSICGRGQLFLDAEHSFRPEFSVRGAVVFDSAAYLNSSEGETVNIGTAYPHGASYTFFMLDRQQSFQTAGKTPSEEEVSCSFCGLLQCIDPGAGRVPLCISCHSSLQEKNGESQADRIAPPGFNGKTRIEMGEQLSISMRIICTFDKNCRTKIATFKKGNVAVICNAVDGKQDLSRGRSQVKKATKLPPPADVRENKQLLKQPSFPPAKSNKQMKPSPLPLIRRPPMA